MPDQSLTVIKNDDDSVTYADLVREIRGLRDDVNRAIDGISSVKAEIAPTVQALSNHPMFRMMFGGK